MMYDVIARSLRTFGTLAFIALGGATVIAWRLIGLLPSLP